MGMNVFAQITKVDEEKRLIFGRAVDEAPDRSGEVFDYASSKPYFEAWTAETKEASDGKSAGNLRAMHGKVAAGRLLDLTFDDAQKSIDVVAHVVDPNEWEKVLTGTYTGFSIGGSYVKKWDDPKATKADGKPATRYTAAPNELSLVDRPCIPTAKFFDVRKADGAIEQVEFKPAYSEADIEVKARELCKADEMDPDAPVMGDATNTPTWKSYIVKAEGILEKRKAKEQEQVAEPLAKDAVAEQQAEALLDIVPDPATKAADPADLPGVPNQIVDGNGDPDGDGDDDVEPGDGKQMAALHDLLSSEGTDEEKQWIEEARQHYVESANLTKGDVPGHPFHGNQHVSGDSGSAVKASNRAAKTDTSKSHSAAAKAHRAAAKKAAAKGHGATAKYHAKMARMHESKSARRLKAGKADDTNDFQVEYQVDGTNQEVAKLAELMHEHGLDMGHVLGFVEANVEELEATKAEQSQHEVIAKAEADGSLRKGMYTVASLASALSTLDYIRRSVVDEESREGDTASVLPQRMLDVVGLVCDVLNAMVAEETAELLPPQDADVDAMDPNSTAGILAMSDTFADLRKVGARNSKADADRIQKMHDIACELGGACKADDTTKVDTPIEPVAKLADVDPFDELMKSDRFQEVLAKAMEPLKEKITKLESEPRAPKGVLRVVNKSSDTVEGEVPPNTVAPVIKGGAVDEAATDIKSLHKSGGTPLLGGLR